jgi:hypothetical protein
MSDRELLVMAVKAAGAEVLAWYEGAPVVGDPALGIKYGRTWNPLANDADAFRLMVDAEITIDLNDEGVEASIEPDFYAGWEEWADHGNDRRAATRRAIVQAAASKAK